MTKHEVPISGDLLKEVLSSLSQDSVLVGGQALAFWVEYCGVEISEPLVGAISDDADILGSRQDVQSIARRTRGAAVFEPQHSLSALIGHVTIPTSGESFVNVDVLYKIVGIQSKLVRQHASEGSMEDVRFKVMHPIDVLISRTENLAKIPDKQNDEGITQLKLAVKVGAKYVREVSELPSDGQKHALKVIEKIVSLAKSGSGRKCSKLFGVRFIDAIPAFAISDQNFRQIRWPQIIQELDHW